MALSGSYQSPDVEIPGLVALRPKSFRMEFYRGDDAKQRLDCLDVDGNPIDLAGGTATWRLKTSPEASDALIEKTIGDGLTQIEPGIVEVFLDEQETKTLPPGIYHFLLRVETSNAFSSTVLRDVVVVRGGISSEELGPQDRQLDPSVTIEINQPGLLEVDEEFGFFQVPDNAVFECRSIQASLVVACQGQPVIIDLIRLDGDDAGPAGLSIEIPPDTFFTSVTLRPSLSMPAGSRWRGKVTQAGSLNNEGQYLSLRLFLY